MGDKCIQFLLEDFKGNTPRGRLRIEGRIKTVLTERNYEGVDWIQVAQKWVQ